MNDINLSLNIPTLILINITLLAIGVCLFFIGYLLGKSSNNGVFNTNQNRTTSFFEENKPQNAIMMDDRKYVVNIKTDDLEKKYEALGDVKESKEDISSSISKLKNLKR